MSHEFATDGSDRSFDVRLGIGEREYPNQVAVMDDNEMFPEMLIDRDVLAQGNLSIRDDCVVSFEKTDTPVDRKVFPSRAVQAEGNSIVQPSREVVSLRQTDTPAERGLSPKVAVHRTYKNSTGPGCQNKDDRILELHAEYSHLCMNAEKLERDKMNFDPMVSKEMRQEVESILESYCPTRPEKSVVQMKIVIEDDVPVHRPPISLAPAEKLAVAKQIAEWLEAVIVRHSCSSYASPILVVKNKDGSNRICVDFR